ncbi:MAG TPA: hypothetical protein VFW23_07240 [Tepidisphaeraceae bacterium]|nr:hypothetical protein [Tepidisphaeraceae bacterium]
MNDLLFDVPWWIPTLIGLIGLAAYWTTRENPASKARRVGLILILVAIGWSAMSYFVDTDKEKVIKGTKALVQDVVNEKWDQFKSMMAPDVQFRVEKSNSRADGPNELTEAAKAGAESIHLRSAALSRAQAQQTGPLITVSTDIFSTQELPGAPTMRSSFEFDWEQTSAGWKVREIRITQIGGQSAGDIEQFVPRGRLGK